MLTIVDFIEQYTPTLPCLEWEKSEVVRRRQVKEKQEEMDWIANQEERTLVYQTFLHIQYMLHVPVLNKKKREGKNVRERERE